MTLNTILFFCSLTVFTTYYGQDQNSGERKFEKTVNTIVGDTVSKIGDEIRCTFQDSKNNLWFATNGEGVFK